MTAAIAGMRQGLPRSRAVLLPLLATAALVLALFAAPAPATTVTAKGQAQVLLVRIDGVISPVTAEILDGAIARAERDRYAALVVEVDTPGGLESSMRVMVKRMLVAQVPILTYVAPQGGRAASAGVFIVMAGHVAAMAPGTNIGAATPVNLQGPMDSTLARKATNDASAFARTVAAQRHRNVAWAEDAVRRAVAVSDTEAVDLRVVDFVASSAEDVLEKSDAMNWTCLDPRHPAFGKPRPVNAGGLPIVRIRTGLRQTLMGLLVDPNVAYILLMLGFYGLLFELQNPGAILPGVIGGICIILAFFALSALPVNFAGVALIALAIVFFIAEVKVVSHGVLAAGGVIAMLLGSLFLFQGGTARVSVGLIVGATLATAAFFLFIVGAGLQAQRRRVNTGAAGMVGKRAVAIERLAPAGWVRIGDERWSAVAAHDVEVGQEVEITGMDGLTLRVRPVTKEVQR